MKALVLCAGFGRRLGAETRSCPKPLLSLGSLTIVEHILFQLARAGVEEVFINLHHLAERFPAALGDGRAYGVRISWLPEPVLQGTAGTAAALHDRVSGDALLVHYGDIVTDHPLSRLRSLHERSGAEATVLLHRRLGSNSRAWLDGDQRISRFEERPATPPPTEGPPPFAFSGVCVLAAELLARMPDRRPLDLPRDVFPPLVLRRSLFGQPLTGYRVAVDSPARLAAAREVLQPRSAP